MFNINLTNWLPGDEGAESTRIASEFIKGVVKKSLPGCVLRKDAVPAGSSRRDRSALAHFIFISRL
ncbi:MAG: hypothetical protein A3F82_03685 [Deltaproteobacteria bacterium RIFCSPLOWO2_12_FULL_44_12]|nr:MAG: hypothetical protein A2712_05655 [Deltaproteobacteria bacterium RIFCSPHIGHO2_01_FULL_43_49]OGQ14313.1 MAG: hypothetical protein A3D22_04730 [Deltaproteobacteria bacterium RIFCSPHIGHO2_02_FULL_44_53]OGQ27647.1 MAG: hypothetical protein A3D98_09445 [Deltaproteobacteria bacterium RIFCSPHIGHO2_12_FULL_44_21]OGQ30754.1 MAG: hypothetical protein A2979_01140 [Deltaproteobacteria bacterium RIFCSPLOWO2_01_FULL_45_74]OGQ42434.1 MAG: hypothetical protein A3I70_10665 [Deltaproteobacteria bacterium 